MSSILKVDTISEKTSSGGVGISNARVNLKSYTTTQREALSPSEGDMVYDTTLNKEYIYTDQWEQIDSTPPWTATGGTKTTNGI